MSEINHAKYLCNTIATHRHDNYKRFSAPSITSITTNYPSDSILEIEAISKLPFNIKNYGDTLLAFFMKLDIFPIGENAINFVNDVKSNSYTYTWISANLKSYCDTKITTNESSTADTLPNNNSIQVEPSLTDNNLINSVLLKNLTDKLNQMDERFNLYSCASITSTIRNDHLRELETTVDKLQKFKNSSTINRSYADSKVIPKALATCRFPPGIYPDSTYKSEFDDLIKKFQMEILDFNFKYISDTIKELENKVSSTLAVIKVYDFKIDEKHTIFCKQSEEKFKSSFIDSNEKFQNTAKKPATTNVNPVTITVPSEPSEPTDSAKIAPKVAPKPQRTNNKKSHTNNYNGYNNKNYNNNQYNNNGYNNNQYHAPTRSYQSNNYTTTPYNSYNRSYNQYGSQSSNSSSHLATPNTLNGSLSGRLNFSSQNSAQSNNS